MHHQPSSVADMQNNFLRYLSCSANVQKTGKRCRGNQNQQESRLHLESFPTTNRDWVYAPWPPTGL
jgi:hypothetical protein